MTTMRHEEEEGVKRGLRGNINQLEVTMKIFRNSEIFNDKPLFYSFYCVEYFNDLLSRSYIVLDKDPINFDIPVGAAICVILTDDSFGFPTGEINILEVTGILCHEIEERPHDDDDIYVHIIEYKHHGFLDDASDIDPYSMIPFYNHPPTT